MAAVTTEPQSNFRLLARLRDPDGLMNPEVLRVWAEITGEDPITKSLGDLDQMVSDCMAGMFRQPKNGGNPFLFSIAVSKTHVIVADKELAKAYKQVTGREPSIVLSCATAGTDGRVFYWHPAFLAKLLKEEVPTVMEHEVYHVLFRHPERMTSALPRQRNWAIDYVVDSCIEKNHLLQDRKGQLWGGNLGRPILLKNLLSHIDGDVDEFANKDEARMFADVSCYGRSPESIYDEIMEHWEKSPRKCKLCGALSMDPKTRKPKRPPCANRPNCKHGGSCCAVCGSEIEVHSGQGFGDGMPMSLDGHMPSSVSKQEVEGELLKAASNVKSMRGTVPDEIQGIIKELTAPTIAFKDILFSDCMRKSNEDGLKNDWTRFRRRWMASDPVQYLPCRYSRKPRLLFLLDTSGSMSEADMAHVTSEMQVVVNRGIEVIVVPVDAKPHWDSVTKVSDIQELRKVKIAGRGGTVFEEFFRDFRKYVGMDFSAIAIGTDGDCGEIPLIYKPPMPVSWILTRPKTGWKPSFGRTVPARHERM